MGQQELLEKLGKGNPVDFEQLNRVSRQLAELEAAGVYTRPGYAEAGSLANPIAALKVRSFANASELQK